MIWIFRSFRVLFAVSEMQEVFPLTNSEWNLWPSVYLLRLSCGRSSATNVMWKLQLSWRVNPLSASSAVLNVLRRFRLFAKELNRGNFHGELLIGSQAQPLCCLRWFQAALSGVAGCFESTLTSHIFVGYPKKAAASKNKSIRTEVTQSEKFQARRCKTFFRSILAA